MPLRGGPALIAVAIASTAAIAGGGFLLDQASSPAPPAASPVEAQSQYGEVPLAFEPNAGRYQDEVLFTTRTAAGSLALTSSGATISARTSQHSSESIRLHFPGADLGNATGVQQLPGVVNDLRGDRSGWETEIPTYGAVAFESAYPGTEIRFHGSSREQIEYDYVLAAGADPSALSARIEGADSVSLTDDGSLVASAGQARFTQLAPIAYQPASAEQPRTEVDAAFSLDGNRVGFELGSYDPSRQLVIDPVLLAYSTYLGGSGTDQLSEIAIDGAGAAYVIGDSDSTNFDTVGPIAGDSAGFDVVVSKLNPAGSALVYSTYLGGAGLDDGQTIAVDGSGAAYVAGGTDSGNFPTVNAIQATKGTGEDAFISKLSPAGNALVYSTFLGGGGADRGEGIALDAGGALVVTGQTASANFPTANAIQGGLGGPSDAFVAKLNPAGSALSYSTYLGGGGSEFGKSAAVDASGGAYVTGVTASSNFPTANAIQGSLGASSDAFVSKLNPAGSAFVYSTYLGGAGGGGNETPESIAVDASGAAYVTGLTGSTNFPTVDPIESDAPGSFNDLFVSKLNPAGSALTYSTYLGGNGEDRGTFIAVDARGSAYVAGVTASTDFDTVAPIQGDLPGDDAFVFKLTPPGTALDFSTYLGGNDDEQARGIAVDSIGNMYIAGGTSSTDFPTAAPIEGDSPMSDAFISKILLDTDGDGVVDLPDNCPATANPDQADLDGDAQGDACDADADGDGVPDADGDGVPDADGDGVPDAADACPTEGIGAGPDANGDGCKDPDRDGDGTTDANDACPDVPGPAGCPDVARRLKLSYAAGKEAFKGKLTPKGACAAKVELTIFRAKRGKDPSIGRAKTKANGSFRKSASPPEGSYYAKAEPQTIPDLGICLAAKSKKVGVRG